MEIRERQIEIIGAAGKLLTESGIAGLTTKNLAAKMGFSEAALYRHFKGKDDIIATLLLYLSKEMDALLTRAVEGIADPEEKLKALFNDQFGFFRKHPHFVVAIFSEGLLEESQPVKDGILEIMGVIRRHLLPIIQQGQKQKQFTRAVGAEEIVHIIMGSLRLHMLRWRLSGFRSDVRLKGNKLVAGLLTLIRCEGRGV